MKRVTVICFAQWITQIKMSRRFGPKLIAPRDDVRRKFFPQMGIDVRGGVQEATRQRKSSTKLKYLALRQLKQWKPPKKVMSILSAGKVRKTLLIDYLTQRSNVLTGESYTNKKNHEKTTFKKRKSCCVRAITICCHIASFARFNSTGFISISKSLQSSKIRLKSEIKEEEKCTEVRGDYMY
jgi:hypothetical protein